jgi:hypothetical protein
MYFGCIHIKAACNIQNARQHVAGACIATAPGRRGRGGGDPSLFTKFIQPSAFRVLFAAYNRQRSTAALPGKNLLGRNQPEAIHNALFRCIQQVRGSKQRVNELHG